jgi:hypothetical protein
MIYTDGELLVSDTSLTELHLFANVIGLKKKWFRDKFIPHYGLTGSMKRKALKFGAIFVEEKDEIKRLGKKLRKRLRSFKYEEAGQ